MSELMVKEIIHAFLRYRSVVQITRHVESSRDSVLKLLPFIRSVMEEDVPDMFSGVVEVDETYVGGIWKNKPLRIRRQIFMRGPRDEKQTVFGVLERRRGLVRAFIVPNIKQRRVVAILRRTVVKGSMVYTDGYPLYRSLPKFGYRHAAVDHRAHEYVRGDVHTNTVEGFWAQLKKRLSTTGGIRKERIGHYIAEEVWRYNNRKNKEEANVDRLFFLLQEKFGG